MVFGELLPTFARFDGISIPCPGQVFSSSCARAYLPEPNGSSANFFLFSPIPLFPFFFLTGPRSPRPCYVSHSRTSTLRGHSSYSIHSLFSNGPFVYPFSGPPSLNLRKPHRTRHVIFPFWGSSRAPGPLPVYPPFPSCLRVPLLFSCRITGSEVLWRRFSRRFSPTIFPSCFFFVSPKAAFNFHCQDYWKPNGLAI